MSTVRRTFSDGLVTLTPLLVLGGLGWWTYSYLRSIPFFMFIGSPLLRASLGVLGALVILTLGYFMRTVGGSVLDQVIQDFVNRFPVIRIVYNAVKRTLETVLTHSGTLRQPVKIEAWNGCRMVAFETGNRTPDGKTIVFIPGAPEITSGFVADVDPDRIIETDDTLLDVIVRLLSCGFGEADTRDG